MVIRSVTAIPFLRTEVFSPAAANVQGITHKNAFRMLLLVVLLLLSSLILVWTRLEVMRQGYEITQSLSQEKQFIEMNQRLRLKLAMLKSPEQLELKAEELKLYRPAKDQIIIME